MLLNQARELRHRPFTGLSRTAPPMSAGTMRWSRRSASKSRRTASTGSDLKIPGRFDGTELIRRVRADARTTACPIIVVTASPVERHHQQALGAGCTALLLKSCLPDTLLTEIDACSLRRELDHSVVRQADEPASSNHRNHFSSYRGGFLRRRVFGSSVAGRTSADSSHSCSHAPQKRCRRASPALITFSTRTNPVFWHRGH